ncbi:MHC class I polypeptide-related sequence B-like isoform X2 [Bos javanicus]|uniref:MHC class I polypeptide-related sequence B-like isoform X2 n=1 Tax=Bos javanicus TaxID=9906 RepID=UPI002AA94BB9|nr:MHC class I polypeptide-related sequence B-like isoform X2 [Bos javanicus]
MDLRARLPHSSVLRRGSSGPPAFLRSRSLWRADKIWAMGLSRVWLFLDGLAFFVLLGNAAGSHSLCYNITVLSQDGSVQASSFAEGYLDRQTFLHYDHKKGRAEPWGEWAEKLAAETWETESTDLNESWKELRKLLAEILSLQKEKGGLHSLQETVGCNINEDSHPRGFRLLYFNGELLLSCYPEPHGCTLPQSSARTLAMEMELSKHYQAHVQGELCRRLRSYLESWLGFTERTELPAVNVTYSQDSEGMVHLTGKTLAHQSSWWIVSVSVAVVFIIGFCVYCYIKKRKTASATGRPEPIRLQDLEQFQTEPTDHNGLTHPEFQSLCHTPAPSV